MSGRKVNRCPTPSFAGGMGEWEEEAPPGSEVTSEIVTDWHGPHTTHSLLVKARLPDGGPAQALTPASVACQAYGAAFSPDGLDLYAAANPNLIHFRRNAETGVLTEVGPSPGNAAEGIAVSPDGKNVYACSGGTHVYVYTRNIETGVLTFRETVVAGIEADGASATRRVMVTPGGGHVFVTNESPNAAGGIWGFARSPETGALTATAQKNAALPHTLSIAISPAGGEIYVTVRHIGACELYRGAISAEGVVSAIAHVACGNDVRDVACAPDGEHLYVGSEGAGLQVFAASTLTLIETVTAGLVEPCGVCVSPHGGAVYVGNESGVGQFWRNKQTGKLTAMTPENAATGGHVPRLPVVSPDGRHLYCTEEHAEGGIRQYLRVENWETAGPQLKTHIPVTPGEKISFGMLMNVLKTPASEPTTEAKVWALLSFDDAEGKWVAGHNDPIESATGEHRVNGEYWEDIEVPAGAASLHIATVLDAGEAIGQEAEWKQDEIQITDGVTLGEYADGSLPGYEWEGESWKSATLIALPASAPPNILSRILMPYTDPVVDWKWWLVKASDLTPITELNSAKDRQIQYMLNKAEVMTCSLNLLDPKTEYIEELSTAIIGYRNGRAVCGGPVFDVDEKGTESKLTITAKGWSELLNGRLLHTGEEFKLMREAYEASGGSAYTNIGEEQAISLAYHNEFATVIARDLVERANIDVETGIKVGLVPIENAHGYNLTLHQFQQIGEQITKLTQVEGSFDFDVDPETRLFNMYTQKLRGTTFGKGKDRGIGVLFSYPGNCIDAGRTGYGSKVRNRIEASGTYGIGKAQSIQSINERGLWEENTSLSDVVNVNILIAYANIQVATLENPFRVVTFAPKALGDTDRKISRVPRPFDDYELGDIVYGRVEKGPRFRVGVDTPQPLRIFGFTLGIDENGVEKVSNVQTVYSS